MAKKTLERIPPISDELLAMSTEQLLLAGEKDEIFRRQFNKLVKRQSA